MEEHFCNLGVMVSTSGYRIGKGLGIAESIYVNTIKGRFHLLLTVDSLRQVLFDSKPPLAILRELLDYAVNDKYQNDKELQARYSKQYCQKIAKEEFDRLMAS